MSSLLSPANQAAIEITLPGMIASRVTHFDMAVPFGHPTGGDRGQLGQHTSHLEYLYPSRIHVPDQLSEASFV